MLAANPPHRPGRLRPADDPLENRLYDWNFVRWLRGMVERLHRAFSRARARGSKGVKTLSTTSTTGTRPPAMVSRSADDYYERCSLVRRAGANRQVPGLIVHAMDDPFVTHEPSAAPHRPRALALELVTHGGHLGYLSRRPWEGDRRWLDARLATRCCHSAALHRSG